MRCIVDWGIEAPRTLSMPIRAGVADALLRAWDLGFRAAGAGWVHVTLPALLYVTLGYTACVDCFRAGNSAVEPSDFEHGIILASRELPLLTGSM